MLTVLEVALVSLERGLGGALRLHTPHVLTELVLMLRAGESATVRSDMLQER